MKKIVIPFLFLIISCQVSFAKSVDENTAKTIGSNFLVNQGKSVKPADLSLAWQGTSNINGSVVTDLYVFNAGNSGFVIVSGDDKVMPVLAYDLESSFSFNNLYTNINGWLNIYKNEISSVINNNNVIASAATNQQWSSLLQSRPAAAARTTTSYLVGPLVQAKWNQAPNYNLLCPYDVSDSALAVTGCVATCMAQVMKYWGWPVTGTGSNTYMSPYGTLSANYATETYKWDSMPNSISDTNMFIAKLMLDVGISVDMNYGVSGSSAAFDIASSGGGNCAEMALQTYFGYQPATIQGVSRDNYDDSDWVHLVRSEVDAKRPVLYDGFGGDGGHAFVTDGYNRDNNFLHFNWGWGGTANGYYAVENLDPTGITFNDNQHLIIGIMPDTVSLTPPTPPVTGVNQVVTKGAVNIYPNPATEVVNIDLQGTTASQIRISDLQGRVLTSITPSSTASVVSIPVNELSEGVYLVQLQTANGLVTKKVVVAR